MRDERHVILRSTHLRRDTLALAVPNARLERIGRQVRRRHDGAQTTPVRDVEVGVAVITAVGHTPRILHGGGCGSVQGSQVDRDGVGVCRTASVVEHYPLRVERDGWVAIASVPARPRRAVVPAKRPACRVQRGALLDAEQRGVDLHVELRSRRCHLIFAASNTLLCVCVCVCVYV